MKLQEAHEPRKQEAQKRLEEELERLKRSLDAGYNLRVRWIPNGKSKLSGEVKGTVIYIYEEYEG